MTTISTTVRPRLLNRTSARWSGLLLGTLWFQFGTAFASPPETESQFETKLQECLVLRASTEAGVLATCLADAADRLVQGIKYEACRWNLEGESCPPGMDPSNPTRLDCNDLKALSGVQRARCEFLKGGEELLDELRKQQPPNLAQIQSLAGQFSTLYPEKAYTLVSQGGVSLGSWQAGYAYLITERLKSLQASSTAPVYRTVAGASAGAVNALAFGLEGCRSRQRHPQETLAWKVWVEHLRLFPSTGRPGLLDEPTNNGLGAALFSDAPLRSAMDDARREFAELSSETTNGCEFRLGFVTTHLTESTPPIHVIVDQQGNERYITAPRASERFALDVNVHPKSPTVVSVAA